MLDSDTLHHLVDCSYLENGSQLRSLRLRHRLLFRRHKATTLGLRTQAANFQCQTIATPLRQLAKRGKENRTLQFGQKEIVIQQKVRPESIEMQFSDAGYSA
jgi:hypothetical protein